MTMMPSRLLLMLDAQHGQTEEHDVDLQEERGATQYVDIDHGDGAEQPVTRDLEHGEEQAECQGEGIRDHDDAEAQQPARHQRGKRRHEKLRLEEHAEEWVGVPDAHPLLSVKPVDDRLERRVGYDGDGGRVVKGLLAVGVDVGAGDGVVTTLGGKLHARDLEADEGTRTNGLVEGHGDGVPVALGGAAHVDAG